MDEDKITIKFTEKQVSTLIALCATSTFELKNSNITRKAILEDLPDKQGLAQSKPIKKMKRNFKSAEKEIKIKDKILEILNKAYYHGR